MKEWSSRRCSERPRSHWVSTAARRSWETGGPFAFGVVRVRSRAGTVSRTFGVAQPRGRARSTLPAKKSSPKTRYSRHLLNEAHSTNPLHSLSTSREKVVSQDAIFTPPVERSSTAHTHRAHSTLPVKKSSPKTRYSRHLLNETHSANPPRSFNTSREKVVSQDAIFTPPVERGTSGKHTMRRCHRKVPVNALQAGTRAGVPA